MRKFLLIAAVASWLLYLLLCAGFDTAQSASNAAVEAAEDQVEEASK